MANDESQDSGTPAADLVARLLPSVASLSEEEWARRESELADLNQRQAAALRERDRNRDMAALLAVGLSHKHLSIIGDGEVRRTPAIEALGKTGATGIWVLSGGVGCGKTTATHLWLLPPGQITAPHRVAFVSAHEFSRTSRYHGKVERLVAPDRLVVDDLGAEYMDEKGSLLCDLDELLDARVRAGRATMLTTNLGLEQFRTRYGARIASRVREDGKWLPVDGPDLRGRRS